MGKKQFIKIIFIFSFFYNIFFIATHLIFAYFEKCSFFDFSLLVRVIVNIPLSIIFGYLLIPFFLKEVKQKVYLDIAEKDIIKVMQDANYVLFKKDKNRYIFKSKNLIKSINYFGKTGVTVEKYDNYLVLYGIENIIKLIANRFEKYKI